MRTVYDAIRDIRERAESEYDKGMRFEAASRYYLKNDPLYRNKFSQVWAWSDAPTNDGHDYGIDIVAQDADDGTLWAIQCKCYDDDATLTEKELGTFYSAAHHAKYAHTMIISTTSRYTPNLDKVARHHETVRIDLAKMADAEIDWEPFIYNRPEAGKRVLYEVRPHQRRAIDDILRDFNRGITRGKLIMACGTGKTLTALRFAEEFLGRGGKNGRGAFVLFLAPSISLVSQSLRAWAAQAVNPLKAEVVCSDKTSSKPNEDAWENSLADIPYPADTNAEMVAKHIASKKNPDGLTVVFSTYQSREVIYEAQHKYRMPDFDLIICDEAHRTTGASKIGVSAKDASAFIRIHDKDYVRGKFRLYMTATPKIYGDKVKKKAQFDDYAVSSMDDADIFGPELHKLSFGEAIDQQLLTDYKPIALTVSTDAIAPEIQREFAGPEGLELDEPARIVGCYKGLSRESTPSRAAVAFCNTIAESKRMAKYFVDVVDKYAETERALGREVPNLVCAAKHVDGSMSSAERRELLDWLATREDTEDGRPVCHILFNARCLAEGVDVPSLDAVLFLRPKKSQIDVIQAVGRVMRRSPGKEYGYIILPLVIPAGMDADTALDQSDDFAIIWSVAKALRSHDERMEAVINALQYDADAKPPIEVDFLGADRVEETKADYDASEPESHEQMTLDLDEHTLRKAVNALLVKKCGTKVYWQDWAKDIAEIAKVYIERIKRRVCPASAEAPEGEARADFVKFLRGLRDSLNEGITEAEAVEMLAQHAITLPIFEALFGGSQFAKLNPVSEAMEKMLAVLRRFNLTNLDEERELHSLYASVRMRCEQVTTDAGRQKLIKELYENFFQQAFKRTSEKMGIVYTPTEVVDYILHAAARIMKREFGAELSDPNVHILDPFTGTGTFIQRLIASPDLIPDDRLPHKYAHELHATEIMLMAYYIASINIEHAYHYRMKGDYLPFPGAVLADTFQMSEEGNPLDFGAFEKNTRRAVEQYKLPVRVIIGNPPYSAGQKNANDNNANESYPTLDARIASTYVAKSESTNKNALYDSYIRAFRWATDRIGDNGIIAFVTNAGWLRGGASAGFRRCLADEFNSIYVFDLRGNQRTQGEMSRKEGGKIFGSGSRAPIAITILVKNPASAEHGVIRYCDIGDYLTREEKLDIVRQNIGRDPLADTSSSPAWQVLTPDAHGDWLDQRDDSWNNYLPLGIEKFKEPSGIFTVWSSGLKTSRDDWSWSFSRDNLADNMQKHIDFYNAERLRYIEAGTKVEPAKFVQYDETSCKWDGGLLEHCARNDEILFSADHIVKGIYRPFCKQYVYYHTPLIQRTYQQHSLFPPDVIGSSAKAKQGSQKSSAVNNINKMSPPPYCIDTRYSNLVIVIPGLNGNRGFSCFMADCLPDLNFQNAGGQCFPLYYYPKKSAKTCEGDLFADETSDSCAGNSAAYSQTLPAGEKGLCPENGLPQPVYAITEKTVEAFRKVYPDAFAGAEPTAAKRNKDLGRFARQPASRFNLAGKAGTLSQLAPAHQPAGVISRETQAQQATSAPAHRPAGFTSRETQTRQASSAPTHRPAGLTSRETQTQQASSAPAHQLAGLASRETQAQQATSAPAHPTEIGPEDIFFYIYAVLHHPEYRARFADNLTKEMPRIPFLKGFTLYSYIGRMLAKLHVDYETAPMYPLKEEYAGDPSVLAENPGKITKLKFGKTKTADGKSVADKSVIICNENVVLSGIPASAYDYVVNGRSAIEWLIDRYQITTAKGSGIVNDPNLYSDNPRYIIDLIKRVTHVSLETTKLIAMLPEWEVLESI